MRRCLGLIAIAVFPVLALAQASPVGEAPPTKDALVTGTDRRGPGYRRILAPDGGPLWLAEEGAAPLDYEDEVREAYRGDLDGDGIDDYILNLGACGNWGHCVHAILLGRADGLWSLAMDPDYVYGFEIEPSTGGGPVTLWELSRGAMAGRDDLGRYRWGLRDGRFHRTADFELIQLMRSFGEPKLKKPQIRRLQGGPETFNRGHPSLGEGAGVRVYRASDDGRLGVLRPVGDGWETIEETEPTEPPVEPTWIAVSPSETDAWMVNIEVLASDGKARAIILTLEPEVRWETLQEDE